MHIAFCNRLSGVKGGNAFLTNLRRELHHRGHTVSIGIREDADILFINRWKNPQRLPDGPKIIQRLDGVNHNRNPANICRPDENSRLSIIHEKADGVVYQSAFSQAMCEKYLHPRKPGAKVAVIWNGASRSRITTWQRLRFRHALNKFGYDRMILTASLWRPHKRLRDLVLGFLAMDRNDTCLVILGTPMRGELPAVHDDRVQFIGNVRHADMHVFYSAADAFALLSWIDNCPNVVAEALVWGLPVLCTNQGGVKELVQGSGVILNTDPLYDMEECDLYDPPAVPADAVATGLEQVLSWKTPVVRPDLTMGYVAGHYEAFFESVLAQ